MRRSAADPDAENRATGELLVLRDTARAKSQENVQKFRSALEAFNRGDVEGAVRDMDPQVEWQAPRSLPDAQTYYGHEGVKRWWAMMRDAFVELRLEPGEFKDLGGGKCSFLFEHRAEVGRAGSRSMSPSFFWAGDARSSRA
jgi:hypothetical protein